MEPNITITSKFSDSTTQPIKSRFFAPALKSTYKRAKLTFFTLKKQHSLNILAAAQKRDTQYYVK